MISPPPPVGQFSPPSIPGTPEQHGTPGWLPQWRTGSDHERSPYEANAGDIKIQEINHLRTRQDEPIRVSTSTPKFSTFDQRKISDLEPRKLYFVTGDRDMQIGSLL